MGFGRGSGRERSYPSTRIGIMAFVRQTLFDAVAFSDQQEKKAEEAEAEEGEEGSEPAAEKRDLVKEALLPVVRGQIPVIAAASNIQEIRNALAVAEEFELRLVLLNPSHAYKMLEEIKASGAAVLVGNTFRTPDENEPYDRYYSLAAELHRAGIEFAFTTGYPFGLRTLPCAASQSVAFGLPEEAAFEALTLAPARILGIDEDYGSLEAGKVANVVIWNGNPLQNRSSVLRLWIRGEEMDLQSRQEQLRDKFADVN